MNLYKNHTDREVIAVLDQSAKLTYDAQLNLSKELHARSLGVSTNALENAIKEKEAAIQNLHFLKDLGFSFEKNELTGGIQLKRTLLAIVMDVVSIVIGVILFVVGLVYFWMLMAMFFGDSTFLPGGLFAAVLAIAAGLIGFKMLSGIHRFFDYASFSLIQTGERVVIHKGGVKGEKEVSVQELSLQEEEGELVLYAGTIEVMRCTEDNLVHKKSLEALMQKMIENR